jgi:hypothetical protein
MATNWNAVLANINNASDILAILRKVLGLLDGKVDLTKIDEIINDITSMQTDVDTALIKVGNALSEFDTEAQETIQNIISAGLMEGFATEAELLATRPIVPKKYAKAEDTDVVWFWNKPEGSSDGNYWTSTGLSEYNRAINYVDANPLFKPIKIVAGDDFNKLTKQGNYFHWGANLTSDQVLNAPLYVSDNLAFGVLIVRNPDPNGSKNAGCTQTFYPLNDGFAPFHRKVSQTTNDFPAWGGYVTRATQYTYLEPLTADQDVLKLPVGRYNIPTIPIGNSLVNMPANIPYKFGRIEVDYTANNTYKVVRFIPYGRDTNKYENKSFESDAWSGWKTFKDYEACKAESDALYATKVGLALGLNEVLKNITKDKFFGKKFAPNELVGSDVYAGANYLGYNSITGNTPESFNIVKGRIWNPDGGEVQYRIYYGSKVSSNPNNFGYYVAQNNINSPDYSGVCKYFPNTDTADAQEIALDQIVTIPSETPFVIVFRDTDIRSMRIGHYKIVNGNLESRGFNLSTSVNDWSATVISVGSVPAFTQAGFQLLLNLPFSNNPEPVEPFKPKLILPPKMYVMEGVQGHIYPEHVLLQRPNVYEHNINCTRGRHMERGWLWEHNPNAPDPVGEYPLTWELLDPLTYDLLTSKSTIVKVVDKNAKAGQTLNINVIGDSTVVPGVITQRLLDLAANDVMKVNLIGTRGTNPNRHEGRGGWTINDYTGPGRTYQSFLVSGVSTVPAINSTTYTFNGTEFLVQETYLTNGTGTIACSINSGPAPVPGSAGTLIKKNTGVGDSNINFTDVQPVAGNPFWNASLTPPALDYANYLTSNQFATTDIAVIKLGINDTFGFMTDPAVVAFCGPAFTNQDKLIASMKAANPNIKVILMTTPSYANQDAFGINYACGQTSSRAKRNIITYNEELIKYYGNKAEQNIFVVGSGYNVDSLFNYPSGQSQVNSHNTTMVSRQTNGVHLDVSGGKQEGDQLFLCAKDV